MEKSEIEKQFEEWIKLRNESLDEDDEKLCYCGHTHKCDCLDPDLEMFKNSLKNGTIILGDKNNGWKTHKPKLYISIWNYIKFKIIGLWECLHT